MAVHRAELFSSPDLRLTIFGRSWAPCRHHLPRHRRLNSGQQLGLFSVS